MVRFQPPSAVPSSRYEEDEEEAESVMSEEGEEKADEYDSRSRRRAAESRQPRSKAAQSSTGRHRFAAPQLDDEDDDTDEEQLEDTRQQDDGSDDDRRDHSSRLGEKHTALYPFISARTERKMSEKRRTARRIPMDDTDELDESGQYQQRERYTASRDRSSSTARNDRPAAGNRKRFVAQQDDEDEHLMEQPQTTTSTAAIPFLADSSTPAYLVTPSLLFTPGTHTSPSADPALLLSQALAALSTPPASTTGLAARLPGVTDRFPRQRRAFGAGWGVDGRIALIRGSNVMVTRMKGDEQDSDKSLDELDRERQGRVDMMVALLQVHHEFTEAQKSGSHGASASLSSPRFSNFAPSSTAITSTSPIATLCDRYIAVLTAVLSSYPLPAVTGPTSSVVPARSFSVASQLRHTISVFQLVKVLYAPEYGSASLGSFLSMPSSSSLSLSLSSDFPSHSLSPAAASFGEMYSRMHHLKEYFKQQLAPLTPVSTSSAVNSADPPFFLLLSSYMVTEATELALSTHHLRLATLLPSLSSVTADLTSMCASQVSEWQNTGVWDVMAEEERKCFLLLAGHKQADDMHWLRGLAMHVCYQTEGDGSVVRGLQDYLRAVENGKAQPALPPYKYEPPMQRRERRRIVEDDEHDDLQPSNRQARARQSGHFDTRFELLSVYSGANDLSGLYSPSSSTPNLLDYSLSFHLHHALSFSPILPYTDYHALLSSYVSQLEQSGLWHWAVYLLMSVQHMQRRHRVLVDVERLARGIIGRHAGPSRDARRLAADEAGRVRVRVGQRLADAADERELWLINHIRVPRHWFTSAHATAAAYYGDYEQACTLYIQAAVDALTDVPAEADVARDRQPPEEFEAAHRILVQYVAPAYIVAGAVDALARLLHSLSAHANVISGWREGGGLYLEYHRVKAVFDSGTHDDRVREKRALLDITRRIQQSRQIKLTERTASEETVLLMQRAALRIMLDDCQALHSNIAGNESAVPIRAREANMPDRHEAALG